MSGRARPAKRAPPRWAVAAFALLVVGFGLMLLHDAVSDPPSIAALRPASVVLRAAPQLVTPRGRGATGPYVELAWAGGKARVMHLCFLSDCGIPPALAPLRAGDRIDVWADRGVAWQVGDARGSMLSYDRMAQAYRAAMRRRVWVMAPIWLASVVLALGAAILRRRRAS